MQIIPNGKIRALLDAWPIDVSGFEIDPQFPHIWNVTAGEGERYVLKNLKALPDLLERTELQHRLTQYLHQHGVPVAYFIETKAGAVTVTDGEDVFVLMPHLQREPTDFHADGAGPVYGNVGRAYARLHEALREYDGQIASWQTVLHPRLFEQSAPRLRKRHSGKDLERLEAILDGLEGPIADVSPRLEAQPILWDCHAGNTLIHSGQVSGFVDCDHISFGPRICDPANFAANLIVRTCEPRHREPWLKHLPRLVEGYASGTRLTPVEQKAFPLAIPFFLLILIDHFQEHGPREKAAETLTSTWWSYCNLDRIQQAVESVC